MKRALIEKFQLSPAVLEAARQSERDLKRHFGEIESRQADNFYKVLFSMQENNLAERHFNWTTGYGYNDAGRDVVERIYADVFAAEAALVRPQIVNGTHALTLGLTAILRPGDEMLSITGQPYDTLWQTIGIAVKNGASLTELGVRYRAIALLPSGDIDLAAVTAALNDATKLVYIQRSSGYSFRAALTIAKIERAIRAIKAVAPNVVVMVDNCYGEFIERREPIEVGANLIAGSLIKNPGGGLALTGGYLAGDRALIEQCAYKLTAPGIGGECGLTFGQNRNVLQGLFMAPEVVAGALKSALFAARLFDLYGYKVTPHWQDERSDIIQAIELGNEERVTAFCRAIQAVAPVDSFVAPEAWDMPGYDVPVIMAAGAFVQGASIELTADAPMRPPYAVYLQGGLTYQHGKMGAICALQSILDLE